MQWQGGKQSRPVQMNVSINRGKKTGSFFWMRLIWTVWALALVLLVRSVWVSLQFASNSTPSSEVSERHKIGKRASQKIDIISSNIGGHPRKKNIINEEPRAPGDKPGAKNSPTQTFNRTKTKVVPTSASASASGTPTATVAHAISFLSCSASLTSKYLDAMLLLRHSIHQNSIHAKSPVSKYSYKMYAFVNSDPAKNCRRYTSWIKRMGYTPLSLPNPVNISSITNDYFRNQIDKTGVAGSSELIKLYLYTLEEYPIVVHWDIDVIVLKPMDDLFDALLFDKDSPQGKSARSKLRIQQPLHQKLPDRIDAFFTRDIALARPWENRQVAQGGFLVTRPSREAFDSYIRVIQEANYSGRCDNRGGWGDLGYGCKQGAMHYQGVVAYFYDHIHPGKGHGVELDVCVWNQVAHSVIYNGKKEEWKGVCNQSPIYGGNISMNRPEFGACHDCRVMPVEETMTVHFTACSKPWQCRYQEQDPVTEASAVTNSTTCGLLVREFYKYRKDFEQQLLPVIGGPVTSQMYKGKKAFHPEIFLGYCGSMGEYAGMDKLPDDFDMQNLYGF